MIEQSYFEYLYSDSPNPLVISSRTTNKVVYMNNAMKKLVKEFPEDDRFLGISEKTCYQTIHMSDTPCNECIKECMSVGKCCERYISHEVLDIEFKVVTTILDLNGEQFNMCKYFTYEPDNSEYLFDEAISDYFRATSKKKIEDTLNLFVEIVGKYYNSEKSYLYQINQLDKEMKRQYFWIKNSEILASDALNDTTSLNMLLDRLVGGQDGILQFDINSSLINDTERVFLEKYNVKNLTVATILDSNNTIIGFFGISNRISNTTMDTRLLKSIAKYIEHNLERIRIISAIQSSDEIDALTGLFRRKKYSNDIDILMSSDVKSIGVIFANINGLKRENGTFGYSAGDRLIVKASNLLKNILKENTIYRISGDEFVTFIKDKSKEEFELEIEKIRDAINENDEKILSVGHSFAEGKHIDILKIINDADTLMYINKQEYYHSKSNDDDNFVPTDEVLTDLVYAIKNEEFLVYLQPKVKLETSEVVGAEALIRRFNKKENKMIFPDQFISLYEQGSIIRHVDIYVLEKVCKLLKEWEKYDKKIPISVNLSRVTLMEYNIVEIISNICKKYEVDTKYIVIEITERIGLLENNIASKLITDFKENGFQLSLDDFGCAYSNIVTLAKIDVEEVKIDKSLVDDLLLNKKNRIIVDNILNMCSSFDGTYAVAEGIETEEQANILRDSGCVYGQGYYYSRPIPNEEFFEKYINI